MKVSWKGGLLPFSHPPVILPVLGRSRHGSCLRLYSSPKVLVSCLQIPPPVPYLLVAGLKAALFVCLDVLLAGFVMMTQADLHLAIPDFVGLQLGVAEFGETGQAGGCNMFCKG